MNIEITLKEMLIELGLVEKVYCSVEEDKKFKKMLKNNESLPPDVKTDMRGMHYRWAFHNQSDEKIKQSLLYKQLLILRSMKKCLSFFVILAVAFILITFLFLVLFAFIFFR